MARGDHHVAAVGGEIRDRPLAAAKRDRAGTGQAGRIDRGAALHIARENDIAGRGQLDIAGPGAHDGLRSQRENRGRTGQD